MQLTKIIIRKKKKKNRESNLELSDSESDNDFSINIKIKNKQTKDIKIGKYLFDEDTLTRVSIVKLSRLGYSINQISNILNVSRMLAWKWSNFEKFKGKGFRNKKFTDEERQFLCEKANGKTTIKDGASTRNLKKEFYSKFKKSISHTTIGNILNTGLTKPLRIVNTFLLTDLHKEKRKKFAEFITNNNINADNIFFTDECRVVLIPKLNKQNNYIRYSKEDRKNRFMPEIQNKRENETFKFEQSIMIAGGVCKYGLSSLIFCSGIQNNYSYKQFLLFMKNDMEKIKKDNNLQENLIFQQDNAACHTSRDSKYAIEVLFGKDYIEWPPNSPDLSPIENVWAIIKEKLEKRSIKNLDDLRENIMDIWAKFPVSLCEKICDKFKDKIKYVEKYGGQRINKELLEKIKKEKKEENKIFKPLNEDDEWVSMKRDNKFRMVFNDKIVKIIKTKFIKQIIKQKSDKLNLYDNENAKLKKADRKITKGMSLKEYNKSIEDKRNIIIKYYDKMEKDIKEMDEKDFIISYLNKEKSENIKNLISANINKNFQLEIASTNISNQIDELLVSEKEEEEDNTDNAIKKKIDKIFERGKNNRVKKYINDDIKINLFPYEPKKLKRKDEKNKINELEPENEEIFNILNEITKLNEKIKKYHKNNKEKHSEIGIEADIESDMDIE